MTVTIKPRYVAIVGGWFALHLCVTVMFSRTLAAQEPQAVNVVLITLDGLRGEEVFSGADQRLMVKENGVEKPEQLQAEYWRESPKVRRELLLPFFWKMCQSDQGWLAGDLFENDSKVFGFQWALLFLSRLQRTTVGLSGSKGQ